MAGLINNRQANRYGNVFFCWCQMDVATLVLDRDLQDIAK